MYRFSATGACNPRLSGTFAASFSEQSLGTSNRGKKKILVEQSSSTQLGCSLRAVACAVTQVGREVDLAQLRLAVQRAFKAEE